ncbi:RNA-directed DNA polymerase, eukaryota [Tanacetum coccineum]
MYSDDEWVQKVRSNSKTIITCSERRRRIQSNDVEGVAETIFGENSASAKCFSEEPVKQNSKDPFKIYDLLKKNKSRVEPQVSSLSLSHPPGFSPVGHKAKSDKAHDFGEAIEVLGIDPSPQIDAEVLNAPQMVRMEVPNGSVGQSVESKGGSVLGNYGMVFLCIWESSIFKKDYATISDNFVAVYGTWIPCNVKVLLISIYAPQQPAHKRDLWEYMSTLLGRWSGEVIIMGDFNEVRFKEERVLVTCPGSLFRCDPFWGCYRIINKKRSQLAIRGILVDGSWHTEPQVVKEAFLNHFEARFKKPIFVGPKINYPFPNRLSHDQVLDLEREVSRDEIRSAVWNCGDNKSPGPDGYTFEFFKKYWGFIGIDFCEAVEHFFNNGAFAKGCNSSFIALIPKIMDAKLVTDFRPISLIGCVYKVVTKILANRLAMVISNIVSNTQSAFVSERQILDGPFIINEVLHWCKRKNKKAMFFKVDFAKAYDSVRWDYLIDVLEAFGFGMTWCQWIRGLCCFAKASVLVNGSPSREFQFQCGLKQGDPLAPLLFILVMESLHLSFSRVVEAGIFKGIRLNNSISLSHLFYADDALIVGEWSSDNLRGIINVLKCFFLASGLQINIHKSQLLGVGVSRLDIEAAAASIGCSIMDNQFRYLGVMVGGNTSRHKFWADVVSKLRSRLSKWKTKTLSIGGRLTLLKSVLGASPLYCMSIFKAPKGVLKEMESIRNNFFIGADTADKKITWVAWDKVLASKKNEGLGVSSYFSLNRALLLKWIWRFISQDDSLWFQTLKDKGFDFLPLCSKRVGDGNNSRFWLDIWKGDIILRDKFPRIFALEMDKTITVAAKMASLVDSSFRRPVRGGIEHVQFNELRSYIDSVTLSNSHDRWICNMSGDGIFRVKDIRNSIDDLMLPSWLEPTKWVKYVPIKINIFGWRARRDCLPTRANLIRRGVYMEFSNCSICGLYVEDTHHVLFQCDLA